MRKILLSFLAALCCASMFATEGALSGKFTVNEDGKQVQFSQGNLQYQASTGTWKFATNQWDTIGSTNANISLSYNGWIDLFGWGTGDDPIYLGSNETFIEWGTNAIVNGGNEGGLWVTLSRDEWEYLFRGRTDAEKLFGMGSVNGVNGTILLPDDWSVGKFSDTENGLQYYESIECFYNNNGNNFSFHTYDGDDWKTMEDRGAVFLPAAGARWDDKAMEFIGTAGYYWSSSLGVCTYDGDEIIVRRGSNIGFSKWDLYSKTSTVCRYGLSVRLVHDVTAEEQGIENIATPADKARKVMMDGTLYITTPDGKIYNATGVQVK